MSTIYTIGLYHRTDYKPTVDGHQISYRLYNPDIYTASKYDPSGYYVREEQWDKKLQKVINHPNADLINGALQTRVLEIKARALKLDILKQPVTIAVFAGDDDLILDKGKTLFKELAGEALKKMEYDTLMYRIGLYMDHLAGVPVRKSRMILDQDLRPEFTLRMNQIDVKWIINFINYEKSRTYGVNDKKVKPNTAGLTFQYFHNVMVVAGDQGIYKENPIDADSVRLPQKEETDRTWLEPKETQALHDLLIEKYDLLISKNSNQRYNTLVNALIACDSGYRISDWNSIDIDNLYKNENTGVEYLSLRLQKNNTRPDVPVGDRLKSLLVRKKHLTEVLTKSQHRINLIILQAEAGLTKALKPHVMRHTFGRWCAILGFSVMATANLLGVTETTAQIYFHFTEEDVEKEVKTLLAAGKMQDRQTQVA